MINNIKKYLSGLISNTYYINKDNPPLIGKVDFGHLRRLKPISSGWGFDRGTPIDRYYIENYLNYNKNLIKGHVLEIGDNNYTLKYGEDRVSKSDIFHFDADFPDASFTGDISNAGNIESDQFDCIIFTQTLQLIYNYKSAIYHLHRILKTGGALLATFPGITQTYDEEWGDYWYWNFTPLSAKEIFSEVFPKDNLKVENFGNVLSATSFLQGLAMEELDKEELDFNDKGYVVTIAVKAIK